MTRSSGRFSISRPLLLPLVPLYAAGLALRNRRIRTGHEPIHRLRFPVVSVGNLSTGGSGKTPLTIALAQALTRRGLSPDVLSRGYGRHNPARAIRVDPQGSAEEFGDEPLLIARQTGLPVYVAARRYEAGLLAEANEPASGKIVHLLDDGFQHRQLHRDIDILLVSATDLADYLLPAGNLREPLTAMHRATVLAIPADEPSLEADLRTFSWRGPIWRIGRAMQVPTVPGPVLAFCGIARPAQFFAGLESAGLRLADRIAFRDHHRYTVRDMGRLLAQARSVGVAALITTQKDFVRLGALAASLQNSLPLVTARLEIEVEHGAVDWLASRLAAQPSPHPSL